MHPMNMIKCRCKHHLSINLFLTPIALFSAFPSILMVKQNVVWTFDIVSSKDSKRHLCNIQIILGYFYKFKITSFYLLKYKNPLQL
jgi:hypothetical protein